MYQGSCWKLELGRRWWWIVFHTTSDCEECVFLRLRLDFLIHSLSLTNHIEKQS